MKHSFVSHVPLSYLTTPSNSQVHRVENARTQLGLETVKEMVNACQSNWEEVCGFITDEQDILYIPNSHKEPRFNFYMDLEDLRAGLYEIQQICGQRVIGVFHTHPTNIPWPSPIDIGGWPNPDLRWRYWIATNHEVVEWGRGR